MRRSLSEEQKGLLVKPEESEVSRPLRRVFERVVNVFTVVITRLYLFFEDQAICNKKRNFSPTSHLPDPSKPKASSRAVSNTIY